MVLRARDNLLICALPGDEITRYANLILAQEDEKWRSLLVHADPVSGQTWTKQVASWQAACEALDVEPVGWLEPPRQKALLSQISELKGRLEPLVKSYSRVYVPFVGSRSRWRSLASFVVAAVAKTVWMEVPVGAADEWYALDVSAVKRQLEVLNRYYPDRLGAHKIKIAECRGVRQYRRIDAAEVHRFAQQELSFPGVDVIDADPWDLGTSPYEQERHKLEIDVLGRLSWNHLVEVGACTGVFTEKLVRHFPDRQITACEPDPERVRWLRQRLSGAARVLPATANTLDVTCDVLMVSSVLYYLDQFPRKLLALPRRYLVASHGGSYHSKVLQPLMLSQGWTLHLRERMSGRAEMFCGFPTLKDGTEVVVWKRPSSGVGD